MPITGGPTDKQRVLFSIWETRVKDYETFVAEMPRALRRPSFEQTGDHPAVNLTWADANAFCDWLTERERKEGKISSNIAYRMPTDHEWSCAVGIGELEDPDSPPSAKAGKASAFPWGSSYPPPAGTGNFRDEDSNGFLTGDPLVIKGYRDGFIWTAPVGSFHPSPLGLYDMSGNVAEYCMDGFDPESADRRVLRGGNFSQANAIYLRSSSRDKESVNGFFAGHGFRVVLGPPLPDSSQAAVESGRLNDEAGWKDFFAEWAVTSDNNFERDSLKQVSEGWLATAMEHGANASLMDSEGRDVAVRVTAKFTSHPDSKDSDQITVRARRTQGSSEDAFKQYMGFLFRSGKAELRVQDDAGWRTLKSAAASPEFDPLRFHTIEISTRGDHVTFHVDEQEIASLKDGTQPAGGRFGINGSRSVVFQSAAYRYLDSGNNPDFATREMPFVNTLGMKFVPVPITGGPTDGKRVLFSVWETRVQDYEVFVKETKREWPKADFEQGPTHPAVMMNWDDATAFCQWLTDREHKAGKLGANEFYRLPTDHEWSCAVGIGDKEDASKTPEEKHNLLTNEYPWSGGWPPAKAVGNFGGEELQPALATGKFAYVKGVLSGYHDEHETTAPVGSYPENSLGLYDLSGNVWEWCEDWFDGQRTKRLFRGGAWAISDRGNLRSTYRLAHTPDARRTPNGFRCVLAEETAP